MKSSPFAAGDLLYQKADNVGVKCFGFDDKIAEYWHIYIDSAGNTNVVSSTNAISFTSASLTTTGNMFATNLTLGDEGGSAGGDNAILNLVDSHPGMRLHVVRPGGGGLAMKIFDLYSSTVVGAPVAMGNISIGAVIGSSGAIFTFAQRMGVGYEAASSIVPWGTFGIRRATSVAEAADLDATAMYLHLGHIEYINGEDTWYLQGYGYVSSSAKYPPAFTGFQATSTNGDTMGRVIVGATRPTTGNTEPIVRATIETDGAMIAGNMKMKFTPIGGMAVKLTNKTGGVSVAGQTVRASTVTDDAVVLTAADEDECFGVFLDSGVADGAEAWVVVAGIADVAMEDDVGTTRGNWVRTSITEAGYADATNAGPPGGGVIELDRHMREIGCCLETVVAGGGGTHILARCIMHFN